MAITMNKVLGDVFGPQEGAARELKEAALVIAGVAALAIAAKIKVPMWPVPITMGTFAVLTIGAAYGPARGMITMGLYLLIGALGFDVFAGSSAEKYGLEYMMGGTGGYLVGYALATFALGYFARLGWDRSMLWMALAMFIGNVLIYVPGLAWLGHLYGWDKPILEWGLTPFIAGDMVKLVLAALIVPSVWKFVRK
ncbi:MAG: biotin transporter BioY [Rhodobacterales bacterium]|nr:MAG: biotin transporter BioY [Rhodobacterales bacterium]